MINPTPTSASKADSSQADAPHAGAAQAHGDEAWKAGMLRELAEAGMVLTRAVVRQVQAQGELMDVADRAGVTEIVGGTITLSFRGDPSLAYGRLSRAIRMNIMLHTRLTEGDLTPDALAAGLAADLVARLAAAPTQVASTRAATARPSVPLDDDDVDLDDDETAEALDMDAADRESPEREGLEREAPERLTETDEIDRLLKQPFDAAVSHIRRDLDRVRVQVARRDAEPLIQSPPEAWPKDPPRRPPQAAAPALEPEPRWERVLVPAGDIEDDPPP
jgi:hypothetical protein